MMRAGCGLFLFYYILGILQECSAEYYDYISESKNFEEASAACRLRNMELTKIDSEQKWTDVYQILTNGNRYYPTADVYIGLKYDQNIDKHLWMDGTVANWTKWFTNEPFNLEKRFCVRLGVDADLYFRTTDCSYQHHFVCSSGDTTTLAPSIVNPSVQQSSNNEDMVIGLSVGFGAFAGVTAACCILCWCCCGTKDDTLHRPSKMHAISRRTHVTSPRRDSLGPTSFDTFTTSRSSKMSDPEFEEEKSEINIQQEEHIITFHKAADSPSSNEPASPRRKSFDFHDTNNPRTFLQYM